MVRCPVCNAQQLPNTLFCDNCGRPILEPVATANHSTATASVLAMRVAATGISLVLPHGETLIMGRAARGGTVQPDIPLDDEGRYGVSRRHALLTRVGKLLFIEDLGSTNGTWLNGRRLAPSQRMALESGDQLRLGLLDIALIDK